MGVGLIGRHSSSLIWVDIVRPSVGDLGRIGLACIMESLCIYLYVVAVPTYRWVRIPYALSSGFAGLCAVLIRCPWLVVWLCPVLTSHYGTMLDGRVNHIVKC